MSNKVRKEEFLVLASSGYLSATESARRLRNEAFNFFFVFMYSGSFINVEKWEHSDRDGEDVNKLMNMLITI